MEKMITYGLPNKRIGGAPLAFIPVVAAKFLVVRFGGVVSGGMSVEC